MPYEELDGVEERGIVAPADVARELVDRQQLDRGHAQIMQVVVAAIAIELLSDPLERRQAPVPARKAQRVQLVDQVILPARPLPGLIAPAIGLAVGDDRAGSQARVLDLARGRVLHAQIRAIRQREQKMISVPGRGRAGERRPGALEPPELAVGGASELDRSALLIGELADQTDAQDVRPGMEDRVPIAAVGIEAWWSRPDGIGVVVEPAGGERAAGLCAQGQQERGQDPGERGGPRHV